jgi:hypothetical protein
MERTSFIISETLPSPKEARKWFTDQFDKWETSTDTTYKSMHSISDETLDKILREVDRLLRSNAPDQVKYDALEEIAEPVLDTGNFKEALRLAKELVEPILTKYPRRQFVPQEIERTIGEMIPVEVLRGLGETAHPAYTEDVSALPENTLVHLLTKGDWLARVAAVTELGNRGYTVAVLWGLRDSVLEVRIAAVKALGKLKHIEGLKVALKDVRNKDSWKVREEAVYQLGELGELEAIKPLLNDPDERVREMVKKYVGGEVMEIKTNLFKGLVRQAIAFGDIELEYLTPKEEFERGLVDADTLMYHADGVSEAEAFEIIRETAPELAQEIVAERETKPEGVSELVPELVPATAAIRKAISFSTVKHVSEWDYLGCIEKLESDLEVMKQLLKPGSAVRWVVGIDDLEYWGNTNPQRHPNEGPFNSSNATIPRRMYEYSDGLYAAKVGTARGQKYIVVIINDPQLHPEIPEKANEGAAATIIKRLITGKHGLQKVTEEVLLPTYGEQTWEILRDMFSDSEENIAYFIKELAKFNRAKAAEILKSFSSEVSETPIEEKKEELGPSTSFNVVEKLFR